MKEKYLQHHGILGMHWGIRRYQNEDGTLTEAGKQRRRSVIGEKTKEFVSKHKEDLIITGSVAAATGLSMIGGWVLYKKDRGKFYEYSEKIEEWTNKAYAMMAPLIKILSTVLTVQQIMNAGKRKREKNNE